MFPGRALGLMITFCLLAQSASAAQTPVVITGSPTAPLPGTDGTGLCMATKVWTDPASTLPQTAGTFTAALNGFFDATPHTETLAVHGASLDLSNDLNDGRTLSYGDFTGVACAADATGGCPFAIDDTTTTYGVRLRGFLGVASSLVGHPVHVGVYSDDAMSFTIYDGTGQAYAAFVRPPQLGAPTWRLTNVVTFPSPGLYPIEILYAQVSEHAALEISMFDGAFTDFERTANQAPVVSLKASGFALLEPKDLYQSDDGTPLSDPTTCQQCPREQAGKAGNAGCSAGYHCNAAALCSACTSNAYCGASCSPCDSGRSCHSIGGAFECVAPMDDAGVGGGPDATTPSDASVDGQPDASSPSDAGVSNTMSSSTDDGGCGCRQAQSSTRSGAGFAALVIGLAVLGGRRKRATPA